jgi:hypothetical protein
MLEELVLNGLIDTLSEFSQELDTEQSLLILDLLKFLLQSGMKASFIQHIHGALMQSALVEAVELMCSSSDPLLSGKAIDFNDEFLRTESYLDEIRELNGE